MYYEIDANIRRLFDNLEYKKGFSKKDMDFVNQLLKQHPQDGNLYYLEGDAFSQLREGGLEEDFRRACTEEGITWTAHLHLD